MRVVYVEDHRSAREYVQRGLEKSRITVDAASDTASGSKFASLRRARPRRDAFRRERIRAAERAAALGHPDAHLLSLRAQRVASALTPKGAVPSSRTSSGSWMSTRRRGARVWSRSHVVRPDSG